MADFIRAVIAVGRGEAFKARVIALRDAYCGPIAGQQNDLRISGNLALLGAALEEFARYLGEDNPGLGREARRYVDEDLPAIRDGMLRSVREQQPSEVFLRALGSLVEHGRVRIEGYSPSPGSGQWLERQPAIGRAIPPGAGRPVAFRITTSLALREVQALLQGQGRPPLEITEKGLIDQLAHDGKLLDTKNRPIRPGAAGKKTRDINIGGATRKAFRIAADLLVVTDRSPTRAVAGPAGVGDD